MEIRAATQLTTGPGIDAGPRASASAAGQLVADVERVKQRSTAERDLQDAVVPAADINLPTMPFVRADLSVDKAAQRVHVRLVDKDSGAVIREYPTEEQLRYLRVAREQIGKLLKTEA
jgi:uncharacterized FlaG/YvyC family protein